MRNLKWMLATVLALLLGVGAATAQHKYIGVKFCAACHKAGKGGKAYAVWEKTAHAKAYETLLSDAAKKIAKEKGLKTAPAETDACLKCHVAAPPDAKNVEKTYDPKQGVTCEACHGPASDYKIIHSKGDLEKAKAAGLEVMDKTGEACKRCHNSESPTFKGFDFKEAWAKIEHGLPAKK